MDSQTLSDEWRRKHRYLYTRDGTIGTIDGSVFVPMTPEEAVDVMNGGGAPRVIAKPEPTPEAGWSEWLDWAGGKDDPLPPDTRCNAHEAGFNYYDVPAGHIPWGAIRRFRYREYAPGGWVALPKGPKGWVPPGSLWDEASPVRCEWAYGSPDNPRIAHLGDEDWKNVTYIRLLPRNAASEPAPELPEWVEVEFDRYRIMLPAGCIVYLDLESVGRIGELRDILAARRRAWL